MCEWVDITSTIATCLAVIVALVANIIAQNSSKNEVVEMTKQLEEMKNAQQQNVRLQLFEKSYDAYKSLNFWLEVAEEVFANFNANKKINYETRMDVFDRKVFGTYQRLNQKQCSKEIREIIARIREIQTNEQGDLTKDERINLKQEVEKLDDHLHVHKRELSYYIESLDSANDEYHKINLSEFVFSGIDIEKIKSFANAFSNLVKFDCIENLEALEIAYNAINKEELLQKTREQLKILEVSK